MKIKNFKNVSLYQPTRLKFDYYFMVYYTRICIIDYFNEMENGVKFGFCNNYEQNLVMNKFFNKIVVIPDFYHNYVVID